MQRTHCSGQVDVLTQPMAACAQAAVLARSGMALGLAGLFIEAHPDPDQAKCDGPCALPLAKLEPYLQQMQDVDNLVKNFAELDTSN